HRFPRLAAIVGTLHLLPEPAAGLRPIQSIGIGGRPLEVVNFPARKVRATDIPPLALCVRSQDKRALPRAYQYPYPAHVHSFPGFEFSPGFFNIRFRSNRIATNSRMRRSFGPPAPGEQLLGYEHDQTSNDPAHKRTDGC